MPVAFISIPYVPSPIRLIFLYISTLLQPLKKGPLSFILLFSLKLNINTNQLLNCLYHLFDLVCMTIFITIVFHYLNQFYLYSLFFVYLYFLLNFNYCYG
ncbi:hypothetical protein H8356DRAFT_1734205 [Neocallimastix lanati (nom. inval.)]|nr:hypothetical protein H8356DRAFT_1734205 [Neocallimastix sp. JGI-2020a]